MIKTGRDNKMIWLPLCALQLIFLVFLTVQLVKMGQSLAAGSVIVVSMDVICSIIDLLIFLSFARAPGKKRSSILLMILLLFENLYILSDLVYIIAEGDPGLREINVAANICYLICPIIMFFFYWKLLDFWMDRELPHMRLIDVGVMSTIFLYVLLVVGSSPWGCFFTISPEGTYSRGPLYILTWIVPAAVILLSVIRAIRGSRSTGDRLTLVIYPLLPMAVSVLQASIGQVPFMPVATMISIVFLFSNFFVRNEITLARMERELTASQLRTLQMQINPHLMYNTLTTMAGLCDIEPKKAQEMTYLLADYMRDGFTDINMPSLVPLKEELARLDHYLSIEAIRFPNITVEKEINADGFMLPSMSLQPLVENAINHGIRKRKNSEGTIRIFSDEGADEWIIRVIDDGVGFDKDQMAEGGEGHFGVANVRKRVEIMCGGSLTITSTLGAGATAEITLPKKRADAAGKQPGDR